MQTVNVVLHRHFDFSAFGGLFLRHKKSRNVETIYFGKIGYFGHKTLETRRKLLKTFKIQKIFVENFGGIKYY